MACRVSEGKGWGPSKTCPLPIWKPFGSRFAHTRELRIFLWECGKGGGTVKTYTLPICKPTVLVCDNANAQLVVRAREAGAGAKSEQGDM